MQFGRFSGEGLPATFEAVQRGCHFCYRGFRSRTVQDNQVGRFSYLYAIVYESQYVG